MRSGFRRMGASAVVVAAMVSVAVLVATVALSSVCGAAEKGAVVPAKMAQMATVSERFQSYNVEMLEVTGGRFWAPYKAKGAPAEAANPDAPKLSTPAGMDPSLYRYRAPIDLSNHRLRALAAALGPAYMRVSGTWANSTYFQDNAEPTMKTPPAGFNGVLTRQEWKGVLDFARAVDAEIVTSFAISAGVRDADGVWTPVEAKKLLTYTRQAGGSIAAVELFNEPTFAVMGGAPSTYDGPAYGRDFKVFHAFMQENGRGTLILGPGSVGEGASLGGGSPVTRILPSTQMLAAAGPGVDGFSYHFYGGVSKRCAPAGSPMQRSPEQALSSDWLARSVNEEVFYQKLRDQYEPGKPMWLTETGETACGGDPWAATFVDSFRYLNQLGALAQRGVQSVMHNTLAASDYALIDETTLDPRPNYWAALLWRKFMGTTVLDPAAPAVPDLHVYAHCLREVPGGVAMLVINANTGAERSLDIGSKAERYTLTAQELMGSSVNLNGQELIVGVGDSMPKIAGKSLRPGDVKFPPVSITFLAMPKAGNAACK